MPIDASIPLYAARRNWSLADMIAQREQGDRQDAELAMRQQVFARQQAEFDRQANERKSLADLAATYQPGKGYDLTGPAAQQYRQADPSGYMQQIEKRDQQQREHLKAGIADFSAAVQWAKTPQDWAIVQQHYAAYAPQLAQIPFERRQEALIQLSQMGEYLKTNKPEWHSVEAGGAGGVYDPATGAFKTVIAPNPGDQPMGAPVASGGNSGGVPEGATATNPQTGEKIQFRGGQWVPMAGGQTATPSGTFRGGVQGHVGFTGIPGETITSTYRNPQHNKAVGGVSNSYHMRRWPDGTPMGRDSVPPKGMSMGEYHRRLAALNPDKDVINEGDHVHMEPRG